MEQAAGSLAALCRRCFGPNGEETLLFRPPDAPIVTGEGHAVLSAWRRGLGKEHALEKFLLDTVDGLHQQLGDGSSEFILLVDAAVRHASDCLGGDRNGVDRAQLSRAFGELKWEIQSELLAKNRELILTTPIEMDWHALQPSRQFHQAAVNISTSALNGVLGEKAVKFVAELVLQWVFTAASEDKKVLHKATEKGDERVHLFCRVQQFLKCAPEAIIFMAAPSVYASYVVPRDEFILKKSVVSSQPPGMLTQGHVCFVCFSCAISVSTGSNPIEIITGTNQELFTAQDAARLFIAKYVRSLRDNHQVHLIISTEALDERVIAACTRHGIACVQLAEPEDIEALCVSAGILSLTSVFDDIRAMEHVGMCTKGISMVRFQQQACLRFRGLARVCNQGDGKQHRHSQQRLVVPQLLLHAPSKGVYKQYYSATIKCLRVLRSWLEPHDVVPVATKPSNKMQDQQPILLYSCRGGGATELAIALWLLNNQRVVDISQDSTMASLSRKILADALVEVVGVLRNSLSSACSSDSVPNQEETGRRRVLLDTANGLNPQDSNTELQPFFGYILGTRTLCTSAGPIEIRDLAFGDPADYGLVHPWRRIDTLLFLVLQTLEQLFRIDMIFSTSSKGVATKT